MNEQRAAGLQSLSFFLMLLSLLIIISPSMRIAVGTMMDGLLSPLIGFDGKYPVSTIFLASLIMSFISALSTHMFTDWMRMGKYQHISRELSKKIREAYRARDMAKVKKIQEMQRQIMKGQTMGMSSQMAANGYIMFFGLLIFMWLWVFVYYAYPFFSIPWSASIHLLGRGPILHKGYLWMWLYLLASTTTSVVIRAALKYKYYIDKKTEINKEDNAAQS